MNFIKNTHIATPILILIGGIFIAGFIFIMQNDGDSPKDNNTADKAYEEKFPLLRELDIPEGSLKGTTSHLEDGWNRYENKILGFSVEYPGRKFNYGPLKPHERKDLKYNDYPNQNEPYAFYEVSFSANDSPPLYINIEPSRFHTISEWIINNPDYKTPNYIFMRREISGLSAVTVLYVPESPSFTDEQLERRTYVIKDDILYTIATRDIPSDEYERARNSFRFLE